MRRLCKIFLCGTRLAAGSTLLLTPKFAASPAQDMSGMAHDNNASEPTPAFHAAAPKDALPPTMDPSTFNEPIVYNAYTVAGRVKKVLYQQPCYCHCDRSQGHGSLLDCFVSHHASGCDLCPKEGFQ